MPNRIYTDFDLLLDRAGDKYRARVINSPDGPASHEFSLPFSEDKLENFILRISQGRRNTRNVRPVEDNASREFGMVLFRTIFGGDVDVCLRNSITSVEQSGGSLRVRLRLSDAPELVDIPWEYLYDPTCRRFLALSVDTPLVRYLDLPGRIKPLAVKPPLKVLVMIASPSDVLQLDVEQEWQKLKMAVADLEQQGQLQLERLEKATLNALQQQLRRQEYHVFHFIGHGGFDPKTNDGSLLLEDEEGRARAVTGQTLGMLMHDERTLRLAFLNACEGGRTAKTDPFAGVGQSLLQQGVPAVIAMQFEVTDDTAITLAHSFYAAVADGYPVDAALTEARKTIFAKNAVEWGTPVLYMRAPDGCIFDVAGLDPTAKTQNQLAALLAAAQTALTIKTWPKAEELFNQALVLEPTNSTAIAGLLSAQQGMAQQKAAGGSSIATQRTRSGLFLSVGGVLVALLLGWLVMKQLTAPTPLTGAQPTTPAITAIDLPTPTLDQTAQAQKIEAANYARETQTAAPLVAAATATQQAIAQGIANAHATETQAAIANQVEAAKMAQGTIAALATEARQSLILLHEQQAEQAKAVAPANSPPTDTPTPTLSPTADAPTIQPPVQSRNGPIYYKAQAGETWASIAAQYGMTLAELQQANPAWLECRKNAKPCYAELKLGSGVLIPGAKGETAIPHGSTYTVKKNDTLFLIAVRSGYTIADLLQDNRDKLPNPDRINPGDKIAIPLSSTVALPNAETKPKVVTPVITTTIPITPTTPPASESNDTSVTAASRPSASSSAVTFTGVWYTNFATLTLQQTGNTVSGIDISYGGASTSFIEGTVQGNTLTGRTMDQSGQTTYSPEIVLTIQADGSLRGTWLNGEQTKRRVWCGVRKENGALPDGCGFSGHWNTTDLAAGSSVDMVQTGDRVTGSFFNGKYNGTLTGQIGVTQKEYSNYSLSGIYKTEKAESGTFRFDLVDLDFANRQFRGTWQGNNRSHFGEWCGWRDGASPPTPCIATPVAP